MNAQQLTTLTLEVLPPPFAWCDIPAGQVELGDEAGTFSVAPFLMAAYPITYAQFQTFIDAADGLSNAEWWHGLAAGERDRSQAGRQQWQIDTHPRENVSWYDATAFCRWLGRRLGVGIRLPTEWEWQWAAQGSEGHKYPWGDEFSRFLCNTKENGTRETTPVDTYPQGASPFGVMDMIGNVWEWCLNTYDNPANIDLAGTAERVMRGGTSAYDRGYGNTFFREKGAPEGRYVSDGFRIVAELTS